MGFVLKGCRGAVDICCGLALPAAGGLDWTGRWIRWRETWRA